MHRRAKIYGLPRQQGSLAREETAMATQCLPGRRPPVNGISAVRYAPTLTFPTLRILVVLSDLNGDDVLHRS